MLRTMGITDITGPTDDVVTAAESRRGRVVHVATKGLHCYEKRRESISTEVG
jgi:hypothetical protein